VDGVDGEAVSSDADADADTDADADPVDGVTLAAMWATLFCVDAAARSERLNPSAAEPRRDVSTATETVTMPETVSHSTAAPACADLQNGVEARVEAAPAAKSSATKPAASIEPVVVAGPCVVQSLVSCPVVVVC
jgi:hypothetical protein